MDKENDKLINLKFLMFENETNICWLDASISLLAHNKTFKKIVKHSPESEINKIISAYNKAINTLNSSDNSIEQRISKTSEILLAIQNSTLEYLKQFVKFKLGEPDSAFCALLNLIYQDKSNIKEHLNASWIWKKQCSNCGTNSKSSTCMKPIITLAKVNSFHPECPSSIYTCSCKSEQEMKLIYKELPPCLIFHFEKGAGKGPKFPIAFVVKGRKYQLTGIVILEKGCDPDLNHFVTWIRNPSLNVWLECNDLGSGIVSFSSVGPEFDLRDVYVCVFESFDNLNKISNNEVSIDQEQDNGNINVEIIDISDEEDSINNTNAGCKNRTPKFSKVYKNDGTLETSITMQNMKMYSNERLKEIEKSCNISSQNVSLSSLRPTNKISFNNHEIDDEFVIIKEFKAKVPDYTELKSTDASDENKKKEFFTSPSNNNKTKESEFFCNNSSQNISISNIGITNKISPNKLRIEAKCKKYYCENNVGGKSVKKEFKAEATAYPCFKSADTSVGSKKENFSSAFSSGSDAEDVSVIGMIHKKRLPERKSTHVSKICSETFEDISNVREKKVNKNVENKLQLKMKEMSLRRNEEKYVHSCERKRTEEPKENSNKGRKRKTDVKYFSSNTEKRDNNLNVQTASTSVADNEISKTALQRSKRTSKSKNSDHCLKKAKMVDCDDVDENDNSENATYISDEKLSNIVDSVFKRIFAVFLRDIQKH